MNKKQLIAKHNQSVRQSERNQPITQHHGSTFDEGDDTAPSQLRRSRARRVRSQRRAQAPGGVLSARDGDENDHNRRMHVQLATPRRLRRQQM